MNIYFLSGLGADSRALKHLTFAENINPIFIDWIIPDKNETIQHYAQKISEKIDVSKPFILAGLSFGGILATEVLQFVKPEKTILISSVTKRSELPFYYRLAGFLKLNKIFPSKAANKVGFINHWLFSVTEPKDILLLDEILTSTNPQFSVWAVDKILNWKRTETPKNIVRINGAKDRVLPITNYKPDFIIKDGGHFMVVNRADEISKILEKLL